MNEEVKKAIEYFKRRIANKKTKYTSIYFKIEKLELLFNLIEQQQKEIEELKERQDYARLEKEQLLEDGISKDKIKAKIKEIENSGLLENIKAFVCNTLAQLL